jgi:hypothetical protein
MLIWPFKASFTNCNRRVTETICFTDIPLNSPKKNLKTVTHVYAHCVTHVRAPRREGELSSHLSNSKIKTSVQMRPLVIEGMDDWIVVLDCRNAGDGAF